MHFSLCEHFCVFYCDLTCTCIYDKQIELHNKPYRNCYEHAQLTWKTTSHPPTGTSQPTTTTPQTVSPSIVRKVMYYRCSPGRLKVYLRTKKTCDLFFGIYWNTPTILYGAFFYIIIDDTLLILNTLLHCTSRLQLMNASTMVTGQNQRIINGAVITPLENLLFVSMHPFFEEKQNCESFSLFCRVTIWTRKYWKCRFVCMYSIVWNLITAVIHLTCVTAWSWPSIGAPYKCSHRHSDILMELPFTQGKNRLAPARIKLQIWYTNVSYHGGRNVFLPPWLYIIFPNTNVAHIYQAWNFLLSRGKANSPQ